MSCLGLEKMRDNAFLLGDGGVHQEGAVELQRQDLVFKGNKCADNVGQKSVMSNMHCLCPCRTCRTYFCPCWCEAVLHPFALAKGTATTSLQAARRLPHSRCVRKASHSSKHRVRSPCQRSCRRWSAILGSLQLPFPAGRRAPISSSSPICARFGRGHKCHRASIRLRVRGSLWSARGSDHAARD